MGTTFAINNSVSLSVTITVNNKSVVLTAADMAQLAKGQVIFSLTQPVDLGTPQKFIAWFNKEFSADISLPTTTGWPPILATPFNDFLTAVISLDALVINQPDHSYTIGVSATVEPPQSLVTGVSFDGIGVVVSRQPDPKHCSTLTQPLAPTGTQLTVEPGGGKKFKATEIIMVGSEQMTVDSIGANNNTLTVKTRTNGVAHTVGQLVIGSTTTNSPAANQSKKKVVGQKGR